MAREKTTRTESAKRPGIKPRPLMEDKRPAKANREAILTAQKTVDAQLPTQDSIDTAVGGPPRRRGGEEVVDVPGDMLATLSDDGLTELKTAEERHEQRMGWFYAEASRQAPNRRLMARDEAFYDNEQISREDAAAYEERGQKAVVYNEVAPSIDWMIGTERRSRVDFFVVAEDDGDEAADDAINKTKLLKYLDDVNLAPFERSYAADDMFKAGLGILEVGLRGDKTGAPIFIGAVPWRDFLHDSRAKKDQSDARYNFRVKEVDLDVALAIFPDKADVLRAAAVEGDASGQFRGLHGIAGRLAGLDAFADLAGNDEPEGVTRPGDWFNARERVTIIECWSREPVRCRLEGGLGDPVEYRIRVSLMVEAETLLETWSPFKHDRFPFVLLWAYRNKGTGMPYSPIRRLIGPQESLNRRMARGIFEASFNQMELEAGAIDAEKMNIEELQVEANDPTGVLVFAEGALSGNRVRQRTNPGAAREQVLLAEGDRQTLRQMSGVNEENRGLPSQATSRIAMDAKAERGSVQTAELFDNLLLARQIEGELTLSLAEQFVKQPMTIRVAGESGQGQYERVKINQPSHYELDPETGEARPVYLNDITARRAHFVVGEQAWKQSYAEAAFDSLMQVLTQLAASTPQIVVALLDVVFDMHPNLPRKKAVLERIRAVNGQADPDGKLTPEQQLQREQQAQIAQQQFELQMAKLKADVQEAQAKGQKLSVDAMVARVQALYESAQAAQVLAMAPAITPIADQILASAGFQDQSGSPQTLVPIQAPAIPGPGALPELQQADGIRRGIETARPDGAQQGAV